jgi:type II secretory pathway pseudopilin PulG
MNSAGNRNKHRAFTLIELLLVVTIIIILISLLMVGYRSVNTSLKEKSCQNNLSKIGAILDQYCQRNKGFYPDVDGYAGLFCRIATFNGVALTPWSALSNVRELKDMGATDALFTCPFSKLPPDGSPHGVGTFDTPTLDPHYNTWEVNMTSYAFLFGRGSGYNNPGTAANPDSPGWTFANATLYSFSDGRKSPITNACTGNTPIAADLLILEKAGGWGAGWFHGGGLVTGPGQEPVLYYSGGFFTSNTNNKVIPVDKTVPSGYNNSACNTLFAGGYVVHSEPSDFQDQNGNLIATDTTVPMLMGDTDDNYYAWFALQPTNK